MSLQEISEGLRKAVESGRTDIVRSVISTLQKSTEVKDLQTVLNESCSEEGTLLHLATMLGEADIVRTLLSAGADPGIHNKNQRIPLDLAESNKVKIVFNEELLQATAHSNMGRVCQLLASGLDVNLKDSSESQNTPLHWASCYASRDMIQCLCLRGADVNAINMDGCTPLHEAVSRGNIEIVEELLIHKADPTLRIKRGDNLGKSALDLADRNAILLTLLQNPPAKHSKRLFQDVLTEDLALSESIIHNSMMNTTETSDILTEYPLLECPTTNIPPISSSSKLQELSNQVQKELECLPMFPKTVVTEELLSLLWPRPQSIVQKGGSHFIPDDVLHIYPSTMSDINIHSVAQVWDCRKFMFTSMGIETLIDLQSPTYESNSTCVLCHVSSRLCVEKASYKIIIQTFQVKILAHDLQSLSYAIITLSQLFNLYKTDSGIRVPLLEITDSPSLPYRGVLLDISKGRVPNLESLKNMLDSLAFMKFNQIHLYTRFQLQTSSSWQLCYSCSELLEIDKFCMDRGMQLVPAVDVHPSVQFEDLPLLQNVFYDYISHFSNSDFINVGSRLTNFLLESSDDTLSIADTAKFLPMKDKTLLISGVSIHDIKQHLIQRLPPYLMLAEYGTQATHNFVPHCKRLCESGFGFFVCPGTAAWNSLAGFPEAAVANVFNAAKCATSQSGLGLLVCHWSGSNFLTHSPFCWPSFVIAAGLSWNKDIHWEFLHSHLAQLMNKHIFGDDSSVFGQVIIELGRIETYILRCSQKKTEDDQTSLPCDNGSTLTGFLVRPDETRIEDLTSDILQRANRHIRKHQADITSIHLNCPQSKEIISEVLLTTDMMILAVRIGRAMVTAGRNPDPLSGLRIVNLGITNLTATGKTDLANRLLELIENFRVSWKRRYIVKLGLLEATNYLQNVLTQLVPNEDAERFSASIIG